jgi:uncharacterized membrane protein YozB (DUF420 family)
MATTILLVARVIPRIVCKETGVMRTIRNIFGTVTFLFLIFTVLFWLNAYGHYSSGGEGGQKEGYVSLQLSMIPSSIAMMFLVLTIICTVIINRSNEGETPNVRTRHTRRGS